MGKTECIQTTIGESVGVVVRWSDEYDYVVSILKGQQTENDLAFDRFDNIDSSIIYFKRGEEVKSYPVKQSITQRYDNGLYSTEAFISADSFILSHVLGSYEDVRVRFEGVEGEDDFTISSN